MSHRGKLAHASFIAWARKHAAPEIHDCPYCGYPTTHPSRTCPAHRDLAQAVENPVEEILLDRRLGQDVESQSDDPRWHTPRRAARGADPGGLPGPGLGADRP